MSKTKATPKQIPEGYWQAADGSLHHIDTIKAQDIQRDALVRDIVGEARQVSGVLSDFKARMMSSVDAFVAESAKAYGAKVGGVKGNVTLMTFDGKYKVIRAMQDKLAFDERLQAAKALIDECLLEWTETSGPEIKAIVSRAFHKDKAGNLNTGRILDLRRVDIQDKRWKRAMDAISDAIQVVGSKPYLRVYERDDANGEYKPLPLDVAGA